MTEPIKIAYLDSYSDSPSRVYRHELYEHRLERMFLYDMTIDRLAPYGALIVPNNIDEEFLYQHRDWIAQYLEQGRIVVSFAQIFLSWLPGNGLWNRSPLDINERTILAHDEHPLFHGVMEYDLNYRRGVKGFFSRGYFEAPLHAEIALKDNAGQTVVYIDRHSTRGTIMAGAGTDLLGYGLSDTTTARRLGPQLLAWIDREFEYNVPKGRFSAPRRLQELEADASVASFAAQNL
ncbi:aspartate/tyrosine/aromatic aminotransferase [Paenibacillus thiaminolyticus]|uniref:aspartate/tyrosine/aromatic aminotransferase n=1 Tax=Paenibacillus thiaminolyticus TaxID=49283 RepID=UPI0035A68E9A